MEYINYYLVLIDYYITTLTNDINETLGNNRYELPSIINSISKKQDVKPYDIRTLTNIKEYLNLLLKFQQILETKLPHCNHNNFYQRLKKLIINEEISQDDIGSSGDYQPLKNKLNIYKAKEIKNATFEHIIFHELLHLATAYQYKKITIIGFCQACNLEKYYEGLNEGYTEILNLRYFSSQKPKQSAYLINQFLALGIEDIVGKEKMEILYFDGNLDGLIDELYKFATSDEIHIILKNTDIIKKIVTDDFEDDDSIISATRLFLETSTIIANIKQRQNELLTQQEKLTREEYEFQTLQTAFYSAGTMLKKTEAGYTISSPSMKEMFVSKDAYRIIKEQFFHSEQAKKEYSPEGYNVTSIKTENKFHKHIIFDYDIDTIAGYTMTLLEIEQDEELDLANVETIELKKENQKIKRKIKPRINI